MDVQHRFFEELLHEWPIVKDTIGRVLMEKWRQREPNTTAESPWDIFKVSSFSIPNASIGDAKWEISFARSAEPHQLWTIEMEGRKPQQLTVDD